MKLHVIDYGHNSDLPASVRNAIPDDATQTQFRTALNGALGQGKNEMHAFLLAWKALKAAGYSEGDDGKWVRKEQPTAGAVHVDGPIGAVKPKKPKDDEEIVKRISGSSPIPLNAKGEALAEKLGKRLAAKGGLDVLHASPLVRAQQTADCIEKQATPPGSIQRAEPDPAFKPWRMGGMEGKQGGDVKDLIKHYVTHPDEVPPGKGADGSEAESFHDGVSRVIGGMAKLKQDSADNPTAKIGVVMHSRGMEVTKGWVDDGEKDDYEVDVDDMLKPDDPEHADVLRWHNGEIKEVDLDSDDPLKPGVYLIMHSLTDDDNDEGNEDLQKVHTYLPPAEVAAAARRAWEAGTAVLDITAPLANGTGIGIAEVRKVAAHFAESASATELATTRDAWGGPDAAKWTARILRKVEVAKAGNGVMLAFWPDPELAKKLAVPGGEKPEDLHLTLCYFGKLADVGTSALPALEQAVRQFAATHGPISATLSGIGRFPSTPQSDGQDVAYLGVHSPEIMAFRQELADAVESAGCEPKKNFNWSPHITLKMLSPNAPHMMANPPSTDVVFRSIRLSIGTGTMDFPLTGESATKADWYAEGSIVKLDQSQHLVFGWASITEVGGRTVTDTQQDQISEQTIENSAYDFMLHARVAGEMHEQKAGEPVQVGAVVESMVFTHEKVTALLRSLRDQNINATMELGCVGWWVGFKIADAATWARVVSGELQAFSVGGRGKRQKVAA